MRVIGVDGCRSGWVAVTLQVEEGEADGEAKGGGEGRDLTVEVVVLATFAEVVDLAVAAGARCIGVDMPVGLVELGVRPPDLAARAFLAGRSSTLFVIPPRFALQAGTHAEASQRSLELNGSGCSQQAWRLAGKIFEVEAAVITGGVDVHEVHPEVSFLTLAGVTLAGTLPGLTPAGGRPSAPRPRLAGKKTWNGLQQRLALLTSAGIHLPSTVAGDAAADDVLDAAVVAWSARRIALGTARPLPDPPQPGPDGRRLAIWR